MESTILAAEEKTEIVIFFNNPCLSDVVESATKDQEEEEVFAQDKQLNTINYVYDLSIRLAIDTFNTVSLESLRPLIDEQINESLKKQSLPYYFKRNGLSSTPQLKDEKKFLSDLEIVDQSILHLQLGIGCKEGEHMLNFELERSTPVEGSKEKSVIIPFGLLPVSEKFSVLQLKNLIFSKWTELSTAIPSALLQGDDEAVVPIDVPQTPSHIRLRDFKGGKQSGPLRDDRILGRCLLGLADGRKLVVQVLHKEEQIAADDILISLRVASYFGDDKALSGPIELPMQRSNTIKHLFERVLALYPNLQEPLPEDLAVPADATDSAVDYSSTIPEIKYIALARGYSSGPALTLKNSLKLKWNDPTVLKDALTATLDRPPLNLRDGSIIVVRGVADFARAEVIMRQKKQQAAMEAEARPVSRGAGAAAVRARLRAQKEKDAAAAAAAAASGVPDGDKISISTATGTAPVTPSNTSPIVEQTMVKPVPALPSPDKLQASGFSADSVVASDGAALPPPQKSPRA